MPSPLPGSRRMSVSGARSVALADPGERMEVSVLVRRRSAATFRARSASLAAADASVKILSREEFAREHGADPADLAVVAQFAKERGLSVRESHAARRTVVLSGTVAQFCAAFGVELHQMEHPGGGYRGRTGPVLLPDELADVVQAVLGLDNRPQAKPHFRIRPATAAAAASYTPIDVATAYGFPAGTGEGECVALIELGGGFTQADLDTYFSSLGVGSPRVVAVSVDQAGNTPTGSGNGPDGEVMLDVEVVGALAPQATVAVYFAPNTDAGFLDAITTAIHDTTHRPSVLSISWGGAESSWTAQAMTAMDDAFQAAAALGITVCVASGDNGSSDGVASGDHVDFPASSGFALACGGTTLRATSSVVQSEVVWNDGADGGASGGGVSSFFAAPIWQKGLSTLKGKTVTALTRRGVPDVAGNADPETGYRVRVDGSDTVIGGTSAVAPLWAGLLARINGSRGKPVGFLNAQLYAKPGVLRDVVRGDNGDFNATAGWDACTGLGSPNGEALAGLLEGAATPDG